MTRGRLAIVAALALALGATASAGAQDVRHLDVVEAELGRLVAGLVRDREGPELTRIAGLGREALPALRTILADRERPAEVRAWAVFACRLIGLPAAGPFLVEALGDPSWRVRKSAAATLGAVGHRPPEALEALLDRLADDDPSVARSARGALSRLLEPADLPRLVARHDDASPPRVRWAIVRLIGQLDQPEGIRPLVAALDDPDDEVRTRAVFYLGSRLSPEVVAELVPLVGDRDAAVRTQTVRVLGRAPAAARPAAAAALVEAIGDPEAAVRAAACHALAALGHEAAAGRLAALAASDEDPSVALAATIGAWRLARAEPVANLRRLAGRSPGLDLRCRMALFLGEVPRREAVELTIEGLADPSRVVRQLAFRALRRLTAARLLFGSEAPGPARAEAIGRIEEWWASVGETFEFPLPSGPAGSDLETDRYRIVTDLDETFARTAALTLEQLAERLEAFYAAEEPAYTTDEGLAEGVDVQVSGGVRRIEFPDGRRAVVFPDGRRRLEFPWKESVEYSPPVVEIRRTTARVFRLRADYRRYAGTEDAKWPFLLDAGGYYSHGRSEIVTYDKPRRKSVYRTLFHETSHQIMRAYIERSPVWLGEGLAEFFESAEVGADGVSFGGVEERHVVYLVKVLDEGGLTPFETLWGLEYYGFHNDAFGPSEIGHYAQSWSLVHFLLEGEGGAYRDLLGRYLLVLREGADARRSWEHILASAGLDDETLGRRWEDHVRRLAESVETDER